MISGRYPYTYACDHVRSHVDDFNAELGMRLPSISRSQASQAIGCIAAALEMTKEDLSKKLADKYLEQENAAKSTTV